MSVNRPGDYRWVKCVQEGVVPVRVRSVGGGECIVENPDGSTVRYHDCAVKRLLEEFTIDLQAEALTRYFPNGDENWGHVWDFDWQQAERPFLNECRALEDQGGAT